MQNYKLKSKSFFPRRSASSPPRRRRRVEAGPRRSAVCRRQTGFTLVETIVALAIFSTSIVGLIVVTASGVADTNLAKNKIAASYLAQEGIELVRNMRDTKILSGDGWSGISDSFIESVVSPCLSLVDPEDVSDGCTIDAKDDPLEAVSCSPNIGCQLLRYDADGFYGYDLTEEESIFTRTIKIEGIEDIEGNINEVRITVEVSWQQGNKTRRLTMTENLLNWIEIY